MKIKSFKFMIFLLAIAWPFVVNAQDKKAVKHNLKSITEYEQVFEKGKEGKELIQTQTNYDKEGNVVEEIKYNQGKISKHVTYEYDGDNNKIRETELDPVGNKIKVTEFKYVNGLKSEKTVYNGHNQIISKKTYKYETY
jgi:hypothetical protein